MQSGYLTGSSELVLVNTLAYRTLHRAYAFDLNRSVLYILRRPVPMRPLADVRASALLFRKGWRDRGAVFLRETRAKLYETPLFYVLAGASWKDLKIPRRGDLGKVYGPLGSTELSFRKTSRAYRPARWSPSLLLIPRDSVLACVRRDRTVDLFVLEKEQFTEFAVGKLTVRLEFPSAELAEEFAKNFPSLSALPDLDAAVSVDLERDKRLQWDRVVWAVILGGLSPYAFLGFLLWYVLGRGDSQELLRAIGGFVAYTGYLAYALPPYLLDRRKEFRNFLRGWPMLALKRWARGYKDRAARFRSLLGTLGLDLRPGMEGLADIDALFRPLPTITFDGQLALDAAAVVGKLFLEEAGPEAGFDWRYLDEDRDAFLQSGLVELRIRPLVVVRALWETKDPEPVPDFIRKMAREVRLRLAFRETIAEFVALGYLDEGWDRWTAFEERALAALHGSDPRRFERDGVRFRHSVSPSRPFVVHFTDREGTDGRGSRFIPHRAAPFVAGTELRRARIEPWGLAPPSEGLVRLRLAGREDRPLPARVVNPVVWEDRVPEGPPVTMRLIGVMEAPAPIHPARPGVSPDDHGIAAVDSEDEDAGDEDAEDEEARDDDEEDPFVRILGRVVDVEGLRNPFGERDLWRLKMDLGGVPLDVFVRKDRCGSTPAPGQVLGGLASLLAEVP